LAARRPEKKPVKCAALETKGARGVLAATQRQETRAISRIPYLCLSLRDLSFGLQEGDLRAVSLCGQERRQCRQYLSIHPINDLRLSAPPQRPPTRCRQPPTMLYRQPAPQTGEIPVPIHSRDRRGAPQGRVAGWSRAMARQTASGARMSDVHARPWRSAQKAQTERIQAKNGHGVMTR